MNIILENILIFEDIFNNTAINSLRLVLMKYLNTHQIIKFIGISEKIITLVYYIQASLR
jgi:hypothetical protein